MKISKDDLELIIINLMKEGGRLNGKSEEYKRIRELIDRLELINKKLLDIDNLILEVE